MGSLSSPSPKVSLASATVFLAAQKLVLRRCLGSPRTGRCFSASEGLFWAQLVAALGVAVQRGPLGSEEPCSGAIGAHAKVRICARDFV